MEGDEDEDDVDDIEHEFKHEEMQKGNMIHGDDDGNSKSGLAKVTLRSTNNCILQACSLRICSNNLETFIFILVEQFVSTVL